MISIRSLLSLSNVYEDALSNLIHRMLIRRLQDGPRAHWDGVDDSLRQVFQGAYFVQPSRQCTSTVLDVVRSENWEEAGKGLRVSADLFRSITC